MLDSENMKSQRQKLTPELLYNVLQARVCFIIRVYTPECQNVMESSSYMNDNNDAIVHCLSRLPTGVSLAHL